MNKQRLSSHFLRFWTLAVLLALILMFGVRVDPPRAQAAPPGVAIACTQAALVSAIVSVGTFDLPAGCVINLAADLPPVTATVILHGNGAVIDGQNAHRPFYVAPTGNLTLDNLTVQNGESVTGGGIYTSGILTVMNSTFDSNAAPTGGGIYNAGGTLTVMNSTLYNNTASSYGGGIYNASGTLRVTHSTLYYNYAGTAGSGIYNGAGTANVAASILDRRLGPNCVGTITDYGYNLADDNSCAFSASSSQNNVTTLNLGYLANNGGPTWTVLPGAGSAAIDRIPNGATITNGVSYTCNLNGQALDTDQRGEPRPSLGPFSCDAGAVEVLAAPTLLAPADGTVTTDNTPTFTWTSVPGAAGYRISVEDTPSVIVNQATYTPLAPLDDYTTYYWRVQAVSSSGAGGTWSMYWFVTINPGRLRAPTLSLPKDRTNTPDQTPTFSWGAVSGAVGYEVQVFLDPEWVGDGGVFGGNVTTTTCTAPELPYGVYYWHVRAGDGAYHWSDWSLTRTLTITILSTPTNAQHITDATPTFTWKAVAGATAYHLQVYDDAGLSHVVFEFNGLATTATPVTPLANGQHWWRVRVNRGAGFGAWTPAWTFTVTPPTPLKPVLLSPASASILTANMPTFTWQAATGGYRYQIQIDNNDTFASPVQDETLAPSVLTYSASLLPDGGKFYWRVRGINSVGVAGAWSTTWNFTLQQLIAPVLLSPANPTTTTDTTPTFAWNPVVGAGSYQLQIGTTSSFATIVHQGNTAATTYTVPPPLPEGKYYWRVRARTSTNVLGKWSAAWVITIDRTGPAMPVLIAPANNAGTADTTPTFSWNAAASANQYRLQVANNPDFTGPAIDISQAPLTYTAPAALPYGVYYWQVRARDAVGNWGDFSPANRFTVTIHKLPKDTSNTTVTQPTFSWAAVTGAQEYNFALSTNGTFTNIVWPYTGTALSTKPSAPLAAGTYYWHVRVKVGGSYGAWMPTWTVIITPPKPGQTVLLAPATGTLTNDYTPTLSWNAVTNAQTYQVQIDNNGDFSSPTQDVTVGAGLRSYIASDLPDALYSWRVRAINSVGAPGAWSLKRTFTVDTVPVAVPLLVAPLDGASSTNTKLTLSWGAVTGAARYQLQLDPDPAFVLPVVDAGALLTYKSPTPLSRNVYYWHVRSVDKAGNVSAWSATRSFAIVAGVTSPLLPTQTPIPTEESGVEPTPEPTIEPTAAPTEESTVEPTVEPTVTPDSSLTIIESNDPHVLHTGNWTAHDTALASGGRYLYSSGNSKDTLTLTFTGSRVDVIFVKHPALGSFVLVLDDTALQTVSSAARDTEFGAHISLTMGAGRHTLRIAPVNGVIAIDAFAVETVIEPPVTPEPTVEPSVTPEPTVEPTAEPTTVPTSDGTLPTLTLPVLDNGDSAASWQAKGLWKFGNQAGMQGGGWFADSTRRGIVSPLTARVLIDLTTAQAPQVRFWQRMGLSSGDLAAVDISLDGGQTWQPLDQQRGHMADWNERVIDLSAYRGQVIRLRFRLDTQGRVPKGEPSRGWWIDNIAVQETTTF